MAYDERLSRRRLGLGMVGGMVGTAVGGAGAAALLGADPAAANTDPAVYTVDVKTYGAKGDGVTDDSAAVKAAVTAAIAGRVGGVAQKEIFFPPGNYRITQKDILMWSPTTGTADQIFGLRYRGAGVRVTTITFDTAFAASADPRENNLLTAAVRLRYTTFADMSFSSGNANNNFAYYWSVGSVAADSVYPQYGAGQNQYFEYRNVEWRGKWNRVIGIDGDKYANNNSEHHFVLCSTDTTATFTDAFLHCGITDPAGSKPQDQFLNYFFLSCNFAVAGGDLLKFDRGGSINVLGGSWSMVGTAAARYFVLRYTADGDITDARLNVDGVRFEPKKSADQKVIDCDWNRGNVTFTSCSDVAAIQDAPGFLNFHRYTGGGAGKLPIVRYQDCVLGGYHVVSADGAALTNGKMIYEGCRFQHTTTAVGTTTGTAFLRYTANPKRYAFRDSWATADVSA
ncbi:glycosyl hydrolase family 28-related protein [Hamadaea tsunoensis]|uniref:glycosyl hydrolase family 28-related protein n=1 Tax=Hamadaea tsunoensis TaxID=53368 RepID=UPI0004066E33|nr:glycosyl hydrolase family 28-related protein [Hamadaea tsunoensis]